MTAIQFLAQWALRSSILILSGALLMWVLRVKDSSIRLAAWTAMLAGSCLIPLLNLAAPRVPVAAANQVEVVERVVWLPSTRVRERFVSRQIPVVSQPFDWPRAAITGYGIVSLILLLRLVAGWGLSLRLRHAGRATEHPDVLESDGLKSPVTLGIARSVIVLPADWRDWDAAKLHAVLAHERSHIKRRDPALQMLSAIHRALLWHSPLSWFLHRRMIRAAEEASDDAAVAVTQDRVSYAEVLLDFMRNAPRGAHSPGVPMARYGRADKRIDRILDSNVRSRGVTLWSVALIAALGAPLAYVVAQSVPATGAAPKFEVASIRLCKPGESPPGPNFRGGRKGGGPGVRGDAGRLDVQCQTMNSVIFDAYIAYASGKPWPRSVTTGLPQPPYSQSPAGLLRREEIEGSPAWARSERYTIEAKSAEPHAIEMMRGPMMQSLLQDRFGLKIHWETRDSPVYEITVARGGPKLPAAKPGGCVTIDIDHLPPPPAPGQPAPFCGAVRMSPNNGMVMDGVTIADFAKQFSSMLDRDVIDKTGLTGVFDLHLDLGPDDLGVRRGDDAPPQPDPADKFVAVKGALQKVGLKLEPAKGSAEFLVIDSISKPSEN